VLPDSREESAPPLDGPGTLIATACLTALVLPLVEGQQHGWPAWTFISLALAPVLLVLFVVHQRRLARRGGQPLVDLALFRERSFSAGLLTQLGFWGGQASFFVVLALYLQQGRGLHALGSGLVFTILAVSYLVASVAAPGLAVRHGRGVIAAGALVLAAGHGLLLAGVGAVGVRGSIAELVPGLLLVGAGMGLILAPLATTILETVDPQRAGSASGLLTTMQNVGNAIGVAVTGVVFFGALHGGYAHAFQLAVAELAVLLLGVAVLTRLLPAGRPR
jgi:Na+/melibiose symporter-like transporter